MSCELADLTEAEIQRRMALRGVSREDVLDLHEYFKRCTVVENSRYWVSCGKRPATDRCDALIYLMIGRWDGEPAGPERYRDFMRIRDELVGFEHEAAEIYPQRSVEIDTENVYHLWVCESEHSRFPFGWRRARAVRREAAPGTKQRPFDPDDFEMIAFPEKSAA
jgi:hypothetical protein